MSSSMSPSLTGTTVTATPAELVTGDAAAHKIQLNLDEVCAKLGSRTHRRRSSSASWSPQTMRAERKHGDLARDRKIVVVGRFATPPRAAVGPRGTDGNRNDNYGPLSPYAAWFTGNAVHDAESAAAGECDADDEADDAHMEEMDRRGRSRKERKILFSRS